MILKNNVLQKKTESVSKARTYDKTDSFIIQIMLTLNNTKKLENFKHVFQNTTQIIVTLAK